MEAKQKARMLLNDAIRYTYDCSTGKQHCSMNCPIGVCRSAIHDAKRISKHIVSEIICSHKVDRVSTEIAVKDVEAINFWVGVQKEIDLI